MDTMKAFDKNPTTIPDENSQQMKSLKEFS